MLSATVRGTLYHRRTRMSTIAQGTLSLAVVDFIAKYGVAVYPFGYLAALAFLAVIVITERRYRVVYMTPAFAAAQILNTMQGPVLVAAIDGSLEVSNKAAGELLGYSEAEFMELTLGDVFDEKDGWRRVLERLRAGEPIRSEEMIWRLKSGAPVDVSLSASLICEGRDSLPVGIVLAALDITERKKAEAALRESEEQLRQAQKMEAIGQLAGGIAHDFNNMLTAIIGNSSLALSSLRRRGSEPGAHRRHPRGGGARGGADQADPRFLAAAGAEARDAVAQQVVTDMEPLLRRSIGEDVELRFVLAPDLRAAEIDRNQIGQVTAQPRRQRARRDARGGAACSCRRPTPTSTGLRCTGMPASSPANTWLSIVTDNGCGMDETTRSRLFEPFFTTKPKGKGTGLGLSTVFGIVKQSGGGVYVYSEPGLGSTFKVYVPAVRTTPRQVPHEPRLSSSLRRGSERIMVVEDEAQVRNLVVRVLSAAGYEVKAAGSAERAEALLDTTGYHPDMLVTDIVLPGGANGRQVADRMCDRFPGLPVLFMSGYTRDAVVHDGRLDEGIAFLEKPFTPDGLLKRVREVLEAAKV